MTLMRRALWLVGATLAYNVIEAVIAVWAGTEADSIALLGFGFDSIIECAAAAALLWRLWVQTESGHPGRTQKAGPDEKADRVERGERGEKADPGERAERVERAERRAHRFVGLTFLALAVYVIVQAVTNLASADHPESSVLGIVLAAASLVVMPILAWAKLRTAAGLGSGALRAEARETLACAYLSFALLLGLTLNAAFGWWWADPVAALFMVPWLVREGVEGVRGED